MGASRFANLIHRVAELASWVKGLGVPYEALSTKSGNGFVCLVPESPENHIPKPQGTVLPGYTLETYGSLVVLDATHGTNRLGWFLFSLLVRDNNGRWRLGGFFLTSNQQSALIQECMAAIKRLAPDWPLRWVINDDSAAEQRALRDFSKCAGLAGVRSFLCQKHWKSAVFRNLIGKDLAQARRRFESCLYTAIDEADCQRLAKLAVNAVPPHRKKARAYLEKKLSGDTSRWASWARFRVPLLLQVPTTSPLEGFHGHLKADGWKARLKNGSLREALERAFEVAGRWVKNAVSFARERVQKKLAALVSQSAHFAAFPFWQQCDIFEQLRIARQREDAGIEAYYAPDPDTLTCACRWQRAHRTVCADLWRQHLYGQERIPDRALEQLGGVFAAAGLAAYEQEWPDCTAEPSEQDEWAALQ